MTLVVISDRDQYRAITQRYANNTQDLVVLCDNPGLYRFLGERKLNFHKIEEDAVKEKWQEINLWSQEKALLWGGLFNDHSLFNKLELNKALYVYFSYYLASVLKNYHFAELIIDKYRPEEIIIFEDIPSRTFPYFNGNLFLNSFLKNSAQAQRVKLTVIGLEADIDNKREPSLKERARCFLGWLYSQAASGRTSKIKAVFLACGGPNHLMPVIKALKKDKKAVIFYDFNFHLKNFLSCLKLGVKYCIPDCFLDTKKHTPEDSIFYQNKFKDILNNLRENQWFTYRGIDLNGFICGNILKSSPGYLGYLVVSSLAYAKILQNYRIAGLILDEDLSPERSFLAAYFKSRGIKNFCLNHGYFALRTSLPQEERIFDLSTTFVHSGYEKSLYQRWGWKEENLKITGIPRYDRLAALRKIIGKPRQVSLFNILFCPGNFLYYGQAKPSYLGRDFYESRIYMEIYLRDIIQAAEGRPVRITIKSHYRWDEEPLKKLIKIHRIKNNIILKRAQEDIFRLMTRSDLVILGNWSTAIMESIILGLPTLVMDYSGLEDGFPFAKEGLCKVARNIEQLKTNIEETYKQPDISHKVFFTGSNDGQNTARVVDNILEK